MKPLLAIALLVGCTADTEPVEYPEGLGTQESPIPSDGNYAVVTKVRLALEVPAIDRAIANVRTFSQNPARSLLALPAGVQLVNVVPASLRANLEAYLNTELDKIRIATKPVRQYATDLASVAQTVIGEVRIDSSLSISPTGALHSFIDLNFTPASIDIIVPIGGQRADALTQRPTADVAPAGALSIGEQRFGLGFGSHAWQAVNLAFSTLYGGDLSSTLAGINCAAIAQAVAARCVSGSCVGHATEVATLCTTGLTSLVQELGAQIATAKLDIVLWGGSARLVDDDGDGIADQIVNGTWDAQTDVGGGLRAASATFVAND